MSYSFYLYLLGLRSMAKTCKKNIWTDGTQNWDCANKKLREIIRSLKWGVVYLVATYGLLGGISVALTMVKTNIGLVVLQTLKFIANKTNIT